MPECQIFETPVSGDNNATSLAGFSQYVSELKQTVKRQYDRNINKDLSRQNWQGLLRRNVIIILQQVYEDSLVQLQTVYFNPEKMEVENGISQFAIQALKPFDGFIDGVIQYALQKHRTSCALSNFPEEHNPSEDYIVEVFQQAVKDWQAFASKVNTLVAAKTAENFN